MSKSRSKRYCCTREGCSKTAFYSYVTNTEYRKLPLFWTCLRHANAERVLAAVHGDRKQTCLINRKVPGLGLFWDGSQGLITGNGFLAYSEDFPEGAKLYVTAHVELP